MFFKPEKKIILLILLAAGICFPVSIEAKTIPEIITNLKAAPGNPALIEELAKLTPDNIDEIYLLFDLIQSLKNPVREKIINCIAGVQDKKYAEVFLKELKHPHPMVRAVCAGMCGKMKIIAANDSLKQMIKAAGPIKEFPDEDEERALVTAILALGELQKDDSLDLLISLLGKTKSYEVQALRKFGIKALPAVIARINDKETNREARLAAIQVLMAIEDKNALPLLEKEAASSGTLSRPYAITTLLNLAPEVYFPEYIAQWGHNPDKEMASRLLYYIDSRREKNPALTPFLVKISQSDLDAALKIIAVNALARNGDDLAVNALKEAAKDKNEKVSLYARQALEMITN
ncbi:MAG: hypothetical protein HZA78_04110 [Candidatus Schekmanbacteria bacterium]|nr:hypothetical protein [Candidatus Schekmanbacteria bacterium]